MSEHHNSLAMANYDRDRTLFSQHDNNCLQHHIFQDRQIGFQLPPVIQPRNEVPSNSSLGFIDSRSLTPNVSIHIFIRCHRLILSDKIAILTLP